MILLIAGCGSYEVPEGAAAYDYAPAGPLTTFPDDFHTVDEPAMSTGIQVRLGDEARADLEGQIPSGFTVMPAIESLDGFGTSGGLVLRFTAPVDPASFDADHVQIWELGDAPAEVPWVEVRWWDDGKTAILYPTTPLKPATRYGLVARNLLDDGGEPIWRSVALDELLRGRSDDPRIERLADRYAALEEAAGLGDRDQVSAAVVWTTQSIAPDDQIVLGAIADSTPTLVRAGDCADDGGPLLCPMTLTALDFMGEDEILDLGPGELPTAQRTYDIPVNVWLPPGPGPHPVVIYGHGLGGDRGEGGGFARDLMDLGIAVVAIDAPSHGQHPFPGDGSILSILEFFGVELDGPKFSVEKLRDHWRSAAWDKLQLLQAIRAGVDADGDGSVDLDGEQIGYSGHSLGGIMGAELMALDPRVIAADLSVPGGRVSEIVERSDTFGVLVQAMRPDGVSDADVARFFPVLQAAIERGDAANYAPHVLDGQHDLLVTMVIDDTIIPNSTSMVLARAFGLPQAPPVLVAVPGLAPLQALPTSGNVDGRTAVFYEYDQLVDDDGALYPATHGDAHSSAVAVEQFHHFWQTRLEGGLAEVDDPFQTLGISR